MPLTGEQIKAAETARRLLVDEGFGGLLNDIVADAGKTALFHDDEMTREAHRQMILAIERIRGELQARAEMPQSVKEAEQLQKAFE